MAHDEEPVRLTEVMQQLRAAGWQVPCFRDFRERARDGAFPAVLVTNGRMWAVRRRDIAGIPAALGLKRVSAKRTPIAA